MSLGGDDEAVPEWMNTLAHSVEGWITKTPSYDALVALPKGKQAEKLILDPLYRSMQREYNFFRNLLERVCKDLKNTKDGLAGEIEVNNAVRALFNVFQVEGLPKHWAIYGGPRVLARKTTLWLTDFADRIKLLATLGKTPPEKYGGLDIWLGGLGQPEAFVAASRQAIARYHKWSLDDIVLICTVDDNSDRTDSYTFVGLELFGAGWQKKLCIIDSSSYKMPPIRFTWVTKDVLKKSKQLTVEVPVYLDNTRKKFLFSVNLERPKDIPISVWSQRGVSLSCWN